jgi:hypothetical protein
MKKFQFIVVICFIGVGISKLNFIERYSDRLNGTSFDSWAFAYGFGAG